MSLQWLDRFVREHLAVIVLLVSLLSTLALNVYADDADLRSLLREKKIEDLRAHPTEPVVAFVLSENDLDRNKLVRQIVSVHLESGEWTERTNGKNNHWNPRFSPEGDRLAFLAEQDEATALFIQNWGPGEAERVDVMGTEVEDFAWHPDGRGMILAIRDAAPETPAGEDAIIVETAEPRRRLYYWRGRGGVQALTPDDHVGDFDVARVSVGDSERTWVAFTGHPRPGVNAERLHSDIKVLDLGNRQIRELIVREGMDRSPRFAPDNRSLAFVTMGGLENWLGNYRVDRALLTSFEASDGEPPIPMTETFDERVSYHAGSMEEPFRFGPNSETLLFMAPEGLSHRIFRRTPDGVAPVFDFDARGVVTSFARSGTGIVFAMSTPVRWSELFWWDGSESGPRQLTEINPSIEGIETQRVGYQATDGVELDGLLVQAGTSEEPRPLLVVIHGGPMGRFDWSFAPRRGLYPIHAFAREGYVVFLPNPRGSGGYGVGFREEVAGQWGRLDYNDITAGVDYLIEQGIADEERMGVMGWSYGGYMTSWTVTQTDRFQAASIGAPITDAVSFYGTTDIPGFMEAYFGGPPWDSETDYDWHSPLRFVEQVETPCLILHGADDIRVPLSQSQAFYQALQRLEIESEMVIYPRSGHGISEPKLVLDGMRRNFEWFMQRVPQ